MDWLFGNDALSQSIISSCARLKTSTLFEDKVHALNELSSLCSQHPLEVGIKSIGTICDDVLSEAVGHESDPILTSKCIDILVLLLLPPEQPYDESKLARNPQTKRVYYECNLDLLFQPNSASGDRIDVFIKLLGEDLSEFIEMQYNIIQILTVILLYKNTRHKLRSELINIYGAMNTLSQLLNSEHEFIRNSSLILLAHLSANDASIQKLIAFDGAFERVLAITKKEDGIHGGMIVEDCLYLMENLLQNNESNQKYFVEIGCVSQLKELLNVKEFKCALKKQQVHILDKVINILMQITHNCGYLNNTQNSFGKIMQEIIEIIAFYPFDEDPDSKLNVMKQKCLILLRIILYLNSTNLKQWMRSYKSDTLRLRYLNDDNKSEAVHPLIFITKLSLNKYNNESFICDPIVSLLCGGVLKSLLAQNRALQEILSEAFIKCATTERNQLHSNKWDIMFGDILLNILSIKKGFGDPLRFWMMTQIFGYLFADNNNLKMYVLSKKLRLYNSDDSIYFIDILMNSLMEISGAQNNYDERIQIAILLLIISICYECRSAIYHVFGGTNKHYMEYMISLANAPNVNHYNRGLATYLIAICMQFARDLTPNIAALNSAKQTQQTNNKFSPYLFEIVHDKIGLEQFKSNLEKLRTCKEYKEMIRVIEKCKEKVVNLKNSNNLSDDLQRKKRLFIEEIFLNEFNLQNDEYLLYKQNRMKVQLFDSLFVHQFEAIYCVIDKRIIQLISGQKEIIKKDANNNNNNNKTNDAPQNRRNVKKENDEEQFNELKVKNEQLANENTTLKKCIQDLKQNESEILNGKITEINELRKQIQHLNKKQQQPQIILDDTEKSTQKYETLRKTYDALNRDHEDLLVFVGHLHDKYEEIQKEFKKSKLIHDNNNNNNNNNT